MSDRGSPLTRYLASRKNTAGLLGALSGPALALTGVLDASWPAVSLGAYAVLALVVPNPAAPEPEPDPIEYTDPLVPQLRDAAERIRGGLDIRSLPPPVPPAVRRILDVLAPVLDRLEQDPAGPADAVALVERLDAVSALIREDLPDSLRLFRQRPPTTPYDVAAGELARQLDLIGGAADRLADRIPDTGVLRAEELTAELRRRYPPPE